MGLLARWNYLISLVWNKCYNGKGKLSLGVVVIGHGRYRKAKLTKVAWYHTKLLPQYG